MRTLLIKRLTKGSETVRSAYQIKLYSSRVRYKFSIRRNITIIQGASATGKTTLVDMVREYENNGADSGISISCEKECVVLEGRHWQQDLSLIHDSIVFIDEFNKFVRSEDFARAIRYTDNYYVIVTREPLENLPYSVEEIYGIRLSGKYGTLKQAYHEFYRLYDKPAPQEPFIPNTLLTEDANSGHQFFHALADITGRACETAAGKSNIFAWLQAHPESRTLIVADGAAFGSQIERISMLIRFGYHCMLYLPESFEWLLLSSRLIDGREVRDILQNPAEYIESQEYFSWEQFFTHLLVELTQGTIWQYQKNSLNPIYLHEGNMQKVVALLPPVVAGKGDA